MPITPTPIAYYHERETGESQQSGTLSLQVGSYVRPYDLYPTGRALTTTDILGTVPTFLGTSSIDSSPTPKLLRSIPLQDPQFPNLWCTRITDLHGVGKQVAQAATATEPGYPLYERWRFNALFELVPYNVLSDADAKAASDALGGPASGYPIECMRWFGWEVIPDVTVLQAPGGQFKFAETSASGPVITGSGTSFLGFINLIQGKTKINFKWYDVPEQLVSSGFGVYPHFDAAAGCVNDASFLGAAAGTLLLEPVQITRKKYNTLASATPNDYLLDIVFPMTYYNPPSGVAVPTRFGHNLLPFKGDWKYYYCTSNGNPSTGRPSYQSYTFTKLFEHYST